MSDIKHQTSSYFIEIQNFTFSRIEGHVCIKERREGGREGGREGVREGGEGGEGGSE